MPSGRSAEVFPFERRAAVDRQAKHPHNSAHDEADDAIGSAGSTPTYAPRAGAMTAL
jgi:hypothetical protein